jgi:zinc D-Ala-D-Ala carboxypeptidase
MHYSYKEIRCPCCKVGITDPKFMGIMDGIRDEVGRPVIINSWYRCEKHDKEVGGKGAHRTGQAADIKCLTSAERYAIISAALNQGANRIGIAETFVHVDCADSYPESVCWVY